MENKIKNMGYWKAKNNVPSGLKMKSPFYAELDFDEEGIEQEYDTTTEETMTTPEYSGDKEGWGWAAYELAQWDKRRKANNPPTEEEIVDDAPLEMSSPNKMGVGNTMGVASNLANQRQSQQGMGQVGYGQQGYNPFGFYPPIMQEMMRRKNMAAMNQGTATDQPVQNPVVQPVQQPVQSPPVEDPNAALTMRKSPVTQAVTMEPETEKDGSSVAGQYLQKNKDGEIFDVQEGTKYTDPKGIVKFKEMDLGSGEIVLTPADDDIVYLIKNNEIIGIK